MAPLYVRLQGLNHPLVAGVRTQITCSSAGARPIPHIIWNKGGQMMRGATQTVSVPGNLMMYFRLFNLRPFNAKDRWIWCAERVWNWNHFTFVVNSLDFSVNFQVRNRKDSRGVHIVTCAAKYDILCWYDTWLGGFQQISTPQIYL